MKIIPRSHVKVVQILRDPEPRYVSAVDHGANQTPWVTVKRAKPADKTSKGSAAMAIVLKNPVKGSKNTNVVGTGIAKIGGKNPGVRSMAFSQKEYDTEEKVRKFLDGFGWDKDSYGIDNDEDNKEFVATSKIYKKDHFDGALRAVPVVKGVRASVGALKADAPSNAHAETAAKSTAKRTRETTVKNTVARELATKFDYYLAYWSGETSLPGVLETGLEDNLPPGFSEVMCAAATAIGNILGDEGDPTKKLKAVGADLADIIAKLAAVWDEVTAEDVKKSEKVAVAKAMFIAEQTVYGALKTILGLPPAGDTSGEQTTPKAPKGTPGDENQDTSAETDTNEGNHLDAKKIGEMVRDAITLGLKPITEKVEAVSTAAAELGKKVSSIAARAPAKKGEETDQSADDTNDSDDAAAVSAKANDAYRKKSFGNLLGISR